jgi:hypothetical protein
VFKEAQKFQFAPVDQMVEWTFVQSGLFVPCLYKKAVMPPKKVIASPNLKYWTKFTTQNNEKQKRRSSFFIGTVLSFPEEYKDTCMRV